MAGGASGGIGKHVRRLYGEGTISGLSEPQLLDRFLASKDEVAFEALVARHGPMVLAVCRRVLQDSHAADDVFQATFLLLVRKAASIRGADLLGPWLHRVAYRLAVRAGRNEARRRTRECIDPDAVASVAAPDPPDRELRMALHEVVDGLPERYRAPVVLCYLEGRTHDEAAQRLRWPIGSVKGRLARAKVLLRSRLERRGLTALSGAIAANLSREATAAVPVALRETTIRAATAYAAGKSAAIGALSASAFILVEETARTMLIKKLGALAASVAAFLLLAGSAAVVARQGPGEAADVKKIESKTDDVKPADEKPTDAKPSEPKSDLDLLQGRWDRTMLVMGNNRKPNDAEPQSLQQITIRDDQLLGTDDEGDPAFPRTLKLDPSASPKRFEWRRIAAGGAEEITRGIYQIVDGTFMICHDVSDPLKPPAGFGFAPAGGFGGPSMLSPTHVLSVYRRAAPDLSTTEEAKAELRKLQGRWRPVSTERNGEGEPARAGVLPTAHLGFQADTLRYLQDNFDVSAEYRIKLDPSKTPHVMELRRSGKLSGGGFGGIPRITKRSYKLDGDTLILCSHQPEDANAPAELVTRPGDRRTLTVYRREDARSATVKAAPPEVAKGPAPPPTPAAKRAENPSLSPAPAPATVATKNENAAELLDRAEQLGKERDDLQTEIDDEELRIELLRDRILSLSRAINTTESYLPPDQSEERKTKPGKEDLARTKRLGEVYNQLRDVHRHLTKEKSRHRREIERLDREIGDLTEKASSARPGKPGTVQVGDILVIDVLETLPGRPLSGERLVRPDGTISLGFFGDLKVEGLTRRETKVKLIEHMRKFLTDEALGLTTEDERVKPTKVDPADSTRVSVDDTQYPAARGPVTNEALERKLDRVLRELQGPHGRR